MKFTSEKPTEHDSFLTNVKTELENYVPKVLTDIITDFSHPETCEICEREYLKEEQFSYGCMENKQDCIFLTPDGTKERPICGICEFTLQMGIGSANFPVCKECYCPSEECIKEDWEDYEKSVESVQD